MNKLLTIAVAFLCALAAQASVVNWNYDNDITDSNGDYVDGSAWIVYLGSTSGGVSDLAVDNSGSLSMGSGSSLVTTAPVVDGVFNDGTDLDTFIDSTGVGYYAMVAAFQDSASGNWFYGVSSPVSVTGLDNETNTTKPVYFDDGVWELSTPAPIPEPTSVALLALGLAALGLKRKVA